MPTIVMIASMPLLWLLGGERLLSPVVIVLATIVVALVSRRARKGVPGALVWGGCFLVVYVFSGFQVEGGGRMLTFAWDFSLYVAFFCLIYNIYRYVRTPAEIRVILVAVVGVMAFSHALSLVYLLVGEIRYDTLLGRALPAEIASTTTGRIIAVHTVGRSLWFLGLTDRLSGIFETSIHHGAGILLSLPILYVFASEARGVRKGLWILGILLSAFLLVYAQARMAILLGAVFVPILVIVGRIARSTVVTPRLLLSVAALGVAVCAPLAVMMSPVVAEDLTDELHTYFVEARRSSAETRFEIYRRTADEFLESPILGHGTQRSVSDLRVPLGSHNWYLAVLYKQGLLGLVPFLAFLLAAHAAAFRAIAIHRGDQANQRLALALAVGLVAHAILALTIEPVVSGLHLYMLAVLIGSALTLCRLRKRDASAAPAGQVSGQRHFRGRRGLVSSLPAAGSAPV